MLVPRTTALRGPGTLLVAVPLIFLQCQKKASESLPAPVNPEAVRLDCIQPFVASTCALADCHDSVTREHGMDLATSASIYDAWVGREGTDHCGAGSAPRVVPGDPDASFVFRKVTGNLECQGLLSNPMPPPPAAPLLPEQIEALRRWIADGAPRTCEAAGTGGTGAGGSSGVTASGGAPGSTGGLAASDASGGGGSGSGGSSASSGAGGQAGFAGTNGSAGTSGSGGTGGLDNTFNCSTTSPCSTGLACVGYECTTPIWDCSSHSLIPGEGGADGDPQLHACPAETADYCGCDGVTFTAPITCADRPYLHPGACGDGFNCDPLDSKCDVPPPECPDGQAPSIENGCFASCVPVNDCRCEFSFECPSPTLFMCSPERRCVVKELDGGM